LSEVEQFLPVLWTTVQVKRDPPLDEQKPTVVYPASTLSNDILCHGMERGACPSLESQHQQVNNSPEAKRSHSAE
jgi:hypothetical protein